MDVTFVTDRGVRIPGVTTAQMREIDRIAIEETGPTLLQMMENAGRTLAAVCLDVLGPRWQEAHVVILAGTGGNGGGGIVAARHLAHRGVPVSVVVTDEARLDGVPAAQLSLFRLTAGSVVTRVAGLAAPDLVVDAIIGYGLRSAPEGRAAEMIAWAAASNVPVVALDVPSGVDATSGEAPGVAIAAHTTLTLALPKTGSGAGANGRLLLGDLGIPHVVYARAGLSIDHRIFDDRWAVPLARRP